MVKKLTVVIAIGATVMGIALLGRVSNWIAGCCFLVAAVAYFSSAYIHFRWKKDKD